MKKIKFILMIAAIAFGFSTMAQFTYGPKVGLNLANLTGSDVEDNKMLIAFNIGALGNYAFSDLISVQAEVLYDAKGAKYKGMDDQGNEKDIKQSLGYVSIPLMAKATFGDNVKFFGEVGPQFGFLMSAKYDGKSEFEYPSYDPMTGQITTVTEKVKDWYKSSDVGLVVGAGTVLAAGGMNVMIDARYNFSFGSIHEAEDGGEQADIKNSVVSINVALLFGGK